MAHLTLRQARLVVLDQRDDVLAGDVAEVRDGEPLAVQIMPDREDLPRGIVERTGAPWSIPGKERSSTYRAAPVTLAIPSLRGTFFPMAAMMKMAG